MIYIGIDNGVTGTIGIIKDDIGKIYHIPVFQDLNYQKSKVKHLHRIQFKTLVNFLSNEINNLPVRVILERPMVNPQRWEATTSALRSLEATLCALDLLNLSKIFIDSKEWQKALLPPIGKTDNYSSTLKKLSKEVGQRIFPDNNWNNFSDADGLLIAYYAKRNNF